MSEASGVAAPGAADGGGPGVTAGDASAGTGTFLTHRQIMIILPGLLMAMLLAMLDQLVVGTALPRIARSPPILRTTTSFLFFPWKAVAR